MIELDGTNGIIANSASISNAEISCLDGVTSNVQTQLNSKQTTLLSGTNIKTINGASILSSGDLSIITQPATQTTYGGIKTQLIGSTLYITV